jgi:tetratricopeptide (TPR) repeat protein
MDSRQVIARFEAERQALALMDHPNIARVLDAGTIKMDEGGGMKDDKEASSDSSLILHPSSFGRLYFVMELVKGVPITKYCDDRHLTLRDRLELFVPVCHALQHAHQKGIIHRDLKPSNILVAEYDDKPVPKLIDFGVAKAIAVKLTERTLFTQFGQIVGTVAYMSPEQAKFNAMDIDTRSDIYGLGILLYELLTGTTPLEQKRVAETSFDEVLRMIREDDPPTPSNRLSTTAELPAIAANRGVEPRKLRGLVRGELDWIVMKCLEKDRNRRYDTAGALAADLECYLHDEPVQACPPSAWYRSRKFVWRNRVALTVAGLALLVLALLAGAGWMVRERAAQSAALLEQVNRALDETQEFYDRDQQPEALAALKRAEALLPPDCADEQLDARVRQWRTDLEMVARLDEIRLEQAAVKEEDFDDVGAIHSYRDAFRNYGIDIDGLAVNEAAERLSASAIKERLVVALDDWWYLDRVRLDRLMALLHAVDSHQWRRRFREAFQRGDLQSLEGLARSKEVDTLAPATVMLLSHALDKLGNQPLAIEVLKRAQTRHENDFWINHNLGYLLFLRQTAIRQHQAIGYFRAALALRPGNPAVHSNLANALRNQGDRDDAEAEFRTALRLKPEYLSARLSLGWHLIQERRFDEAITEFNEAMRLKPGSTRPQYGLGVALRKKRVEDAITAYKKAIRLDPKSADAHTHLGRALQQQGRLDEALVGHEEAVRLEPKNAAAHDGLASALLEKGQIDRAISEASEAVRLEPGSAQAHFHLGQAFHAKRQLDRAVKEFRAAIDLNPQDAAAQTNLGAVFCEQGDVAAAMALHRKALAIDPNHAEAHANLGQAWHARGEFVQAIEECKKALRADPGLALAHYHLGAAHQARGELDEAASAFRGALAYAPNHTLARIALLNVSQVLEPRDAAGYEKHAQYLLRRKRLAQAEAAIRVAVITQPDNPGFQRTLGEILYRQGKSAEGEAAIQRVPGRQPDDPKLLLIVGDTYANVGQWDKACASFTRIRQVAPDHVLAWHHLALAHLAAGRPQEYRKVCAEMLEKFDRKPHLLIGGMVVDASIVLPSIRPDAERIAAVAKVSLTHIPRLQAAALYRAGKLDDAVKRFEQATKKAPLGASDWYVLAMAHHHLRHAHEAAECLQNGIRAAQQTPFVARSWTSALSEDRLRAEAETLLKESR